MHPLADDSNVRASAREAIASLRDWEAGTAATEEHFEHLQTELQRTEEVARERAGVEAKRLQVRPPLALLLLLCCLASRLA